MAVSAYSQLERTVEPSKTITAFSTGKSTTFGLQAGEILRVTGVTSGGSEFLIKPYVYRVTNPDRPELVAADDPEIVTAAFEWTVNHDGRYYVLVRNISAADGKYQVSILRGAKSGGSTQDPPLATVKIFYATNREASGAGRQSPYYTAEPTGSGSLGMGSCLVTIPRDHQMGEIEGPSIFRLEFSRNAANHVFLKSVSPETNQQKFFDGISAKVLESPKREAFVFVHGFNVTFEDAALRTAQMAYDLGFAGAPILYSWPSQGSLLDYLKDGRNADLSAKELKAFLEELTSRTGVRTVHLIAHSMGNRVLTQALVQMADTGKRANVHFRQVALLAPDIDAVLFQQIAERIESEADRVTLYASSKDGALLLSKKLAGYPRAGDATPYPIMIPGIDSIDASAVDTSMLGLFHQYYADNRTILSDLFQLLRDNPPESRFGLTAVTTGSGSFWRFRPAVR